MKDWQFSLSLEFIQIYSNECWVTAYLSFKDTNLQISSITMRGIQQSAHFELLEPQPEHPIPGRPSKTPKPIPARHRSMSIKVGKLWRCHILVDVHRLVTVVAGVIWRRRQIISSCKERKRNHSDFVFADYCGRKNGKLRHQSCRNYGNLFGNLFRLNGFDLFRD